MYPLFARTRKQQIRSLEHSASLAQALLLLHVRPQRQRQKSGRVHHLRTQRTRRHWYSVYYPAPVIQYLHRKKHIQEFVLWGRSMGAVATLLYALQNYQERIPSPTRGMFSATQSLRSSLIHNKSVASLEE